MKYDVLTCRYQADIVDCCRGSIDGSCKLEDVVDRHEQVDSHIPIMSF